MAAFTSLLRCRGDGRGTLYLSVIPRDFSGLTPCQGGLRQTAISGAGSFHARVAGHPIARYLEQVPEGGCLSRAQGRPIATGNPVLVNDLRSSNGLPSVRRWCIAGCRRASGLLLNQTMSSHPLAFSKLDFSTTPFLVIWEVTRACALACRHCRAEAVDVADPLELTLAEGKNLLNQIHQMGTPVCVLSGGDPLRRSDLRDLVAHGAGLGLRMATIPAATDALTRERLAELKAAGLAQLALSLDGSTVERHDEFRKVPGTFVRTLEAARWAQELELPLQINSTFSAHNWDDVDAMCDLVERLGVVFWEVFSLVPVGRGSELLPLSAEQHEELFEKLWNLSQRVKFVIKVTEAPHYRRFVLQHRGAQATSGEPGNPPLHGGMAKGMHSSGSAIPAQLSRELSVRESFGAKAKGINSGKGFCFVSHKGEVFPSGFFPVSAGELRSQTLAEIYRDTDLFRALREPTRLTGRCGRCEYADVCGGSRARALAVHGDYLAEDPACGYQPPEIAT